MKMATDKEIDAIRYYQGDVRKRMEDGSLSKDEKAVGFWGIHKAYKTMNCLMFRGIDNEVARTEEKEESLNPEIFWEIEKVKEVFCDIFRVICRHSRFYDSQKCDVVYRTERGVSIREVREQGHTISFTSTSKTNNVAEYFKKKKQLTLLEFSLHSGIPCVDLEEVLGDSNLHSDQKEILLPPFLSVSLQEGELTEEERKYEDAEGKPPCGKYIATVGDICLPTLKWRKQDMSTKMQLLIEGKDSAADILSRLKKKEYISDDEVERYSIWKRLFREIIIENFHLIQRECGMKDV